MMYDEPDDLDRALFALPLASPPDGLRASLLAATSAPPTRVPFAPTWEIWAGGSALGVAAWLCVVLVTSKGFAAALNAQIDAAVGALATPGLLAWLALACIFTFALGFVAERGLRFPSRGART